MMWFVSLPFWMLAVLFGVAGCALFGALVSRTAIDPFDRRTAPGIVGLIVFFGAIALAFSGIGLFMVTR